MVKGVCGNRGKNDAPHKQTQGNRSNGPDVHGRKMGAPKAFPSPGTVGIIDGERESLPE